MQPMPNLHLIRQVVEAALRSAPADLVVLPEVFNGIHSEAAPEAGPQARQFLTTLARACGVAVVGGSMDHADPDGTRWNSSFVVDAGGHECGVYHKRVMFSLEQQARTPGTQPGVFNVAGVRIAVLICADLWDPVLLREVMNRADLLCVPAKTSVPTAGHVEYARKLWWNLALTRAMESGLPVVVSDWAEARHDVSNAGRGTALVGVHHTSGGSSITDPSYRPDFDRLQQVLWRGEPGVLRAAIHLDAVQAYRDYRRSVGLLPS